MSDLASCFYAGTVMHRRVRPRKHKLSYRVFSMLLDLDELPALEAQGSAFRHNRFGFFSFYDRDHGPGRDAPLKPWVEGELAKAGIDTEGGPIRLLCYPRMLGYGFNPLSVYFCYRREGALSAILYEVCNTHAERHTYAIPVGIGASPVIRQRCKKALYVSPFIGMEADYHFRIVPPADMVNVVIRQEDADGVLLAASFRGARAALTDRALARCLATYPLLTLKVVVGIHWEALRMWLKGFPVFSHSPAAAPVQSSVGRIATTKN